MGTEGLSGMKDSRLVAKYILTLPGRLMKEILEALKIMFLEMPHYLFREIMMGFQDDFKEFKRKENATTEKNGDGDRELTFPEYYELFCAKTINEDGTVDMVTDGASSEEFREAYLAWLRYLMDRPIKHKWF